MPRLTITISDELDDELAHRSRTEERFDSKADVVRAMIERGRETDALRQSLAEREERIERLERELEHAEGQLEALRDANDRGERLQERIDRTLAYVEERQRAAMAPFFVRWLRWWRLRNRETGPTAGRAEAEEESRVDDEPRDDDLRSGEAAAPGS